MARKEIPEAGPFRYIRESDITQSFTNELYELNKVDLPYLFKKNRDKTHVFVYDFNGKILGFLAFQDMGTHFHLDLVETNRISESEELNPGGKLILYMDSISKKYKYKKIHLLALPDSNLISFYKKLGYHETGFKEYDRSYKLELIEMEKNL